MSEHIRTFSAVFPFIFTIDSGKTLILLHRRQNTGYQDGKWDIAGSGHVDEGETAMSALVRECAEELGIVVETGDLAFAHLSHGFSTDRTYYDIYFAVGKYKGTPSIMEPDKCSELSWFDVNDLPPDIIECRRIAIQAYINKSYYSEIIERS